ATTRETSPRSTTRLSRQRQKGRGRAAGRSISGREGPDRVALLPASGRRRRPAAAQVRDAPAGARDRDARAGAGRPEVDPLRHGAPAPDAGVDPPGALHRPEGTQARRGAARATGARPLLAPGAARVPARPPPGRERALEPDRNPGGD